MTLRDSQVSLLQMSDLLPITKIRIKVNEFMQ